MSILTGLSTGCALAAVLIATALPALAPAAATPTTVPATAARSAVAPVHHWKAFMMPSGNIACLFDSGKLRCDILSGLESEPKKPCQFFWKGVMLPAAGRASHLCIIDTIYDADAPKLRYGSKWKRDGIVCRSRTTGLRCHNPEGHGFLLSHRCRRGADAGTSPEQIAGEDWPRRVAADPSTKARHQKSDHTEHDDKNASSKSCATWSAPHLG